MRPSPAPAPSSRWPRAWGTSRRSRIGCGPGCWLRIDEGRITFQVTRVFEYRYRFVNSCTGSVLSQVQVQGTWTQNGSRIEFTTLVSRLEGEVRGDTVRVVRDPEVLTFAR